MLRIHIVQKGDTLWKIAQKYNVDFEELKRLNSHLSDPNTLMPGMKIKIPSGYFSCKTAKRNADQRSAGERKTEKRNPQPPNTAANAGKRNSKFMQPMPESQIPTPPPPHRRKCQ